MGDRGSRSGFEGVTNEERKQERKNKKIENEDYTEWQDPAIDGGWRGKMEFEGDGKDQVNFFKNNTNAYKLINSMTRDETEAFLNWTRGRFMTRSVWYGWDRMSESQQERARIYDRILDKATLDKGIIVNRLTDGMLLLNKSGVSSLKELQAKEGQYIRVNSYMSASAAKEGLEIGDSDKQVQLRIHIPAGSTGAGMWVGHSKINGWGARQREFMTNRNIGLRVGKTTYNKSTGIYTVNMYYEGREEHDYGKKR